MYKRSLERRLDSGEYKLSSIERRELEVVKILTFVASGGQNSCVLIQAVREEVRIIVIRRVLEHVAHRRHAHGILAFLIEV